MSTPPVLCIGSALWDTIARAEAPLHPGMDVPGRIDRQMGGVALNVALALADREVPVAILSAIGNDPDGDALIEAAEERGVDCAFVTRGGFPTDNYNAIEGPDGELFAAVADCHSLERTGAAIFAPLRDGRLASPDAPYPGTIIIDGNLNEVTLDNLVSNGDAAASALYFVPASPGKATRLRASLIASHGTLFANRVEAELLCERPLATSEDAARAILALGASAIITDSQRPASWATGEALVSASPPDVRVTSVTGAGDAFLAGFVAAAHTTGLGDHCLRAAIEAAAAHISRDLT